MLCTSTSPAAYLCTPRITTPSGGVFSRGNSPTLSLLDVGEGCSVERESKSVLGCGRCAVARFVIAVRLAPGRPCWLTTGHPPRLAWMQAAVGQLWVNRRRWLACGYHGGNLAGQPRSGVPAAPLTKATGMQPPLGCVLVNEDAPLLQRAALYTRANFAKILSCRIDPPTSLVYGGWHGKGRKKETEPRNAKVRALNR